MFSDLSGYTSMSERLDAEDVREITTRIFTHAGDVIARFGGRIDNLMGDAVLAVFGDPIAHEDDPKRAVLATIEIHAAAERIGHEMGGRLVHPLTMHSGVNTGVIVAGDLDVRGAKARLTGDAVNVAARLQGLSLPGEILIGPETRRLLDDVFVLEDHGHHDLKGKGEPVPVARVVGRVLSTPRRLRRSSSFIGRQPELAALRDAANRARHGESVAVAVSGDAGAGKSRLVEELRAGLPSDSRWLEGKASSLTQTTAYAPVMALISGALGIAEGDPADVVTRKLVDGVAGLVADASRAVPPIAHLYGTVPDGMLPVDRETFPERLLDAVLSLLGGLSPEGQVVVVLEDLHWADPSTLELLRRVVSSLHTPLLLLCTFRSDAEVGLADVEEIRLSELSEEQTSQLVAGMLDVHTTPTGLDQFVASRTDGNPFFAEELVADLVETGLLTRLPDGWRFLDSPEARRVPSTVRGVIAARIDRLDDQRRTLLREASVVGREFLSRVLAAITATTDPVHSSLSQLERAAFVLHRPSTDAELEYLFKHALTQEVAYQGLTRDQRRQLHKLVATALEAQSPERPEFFEVLAHHHSEAGNVDAAVHYLIEAGRQSTERYALREASAFFDRAYGLLTAEPRTAAQDRALVELINHWSLVHYYDGTIRDWIGLLDDHVTDAERVDDPALLSMYLGWLGNASWFAGDIHRSLAALDRAVAIGEAAGVGAGERYARAWRLHTLYMLGRTAEAIDAGSRISYSPDEVAGSSYPVVKGMSGVALSALLAGDFRRSLALADELIATGRATGNARAEAMGCVAKCSSHWLLMDFEGAAEAAVHGMEAARDDLHRASNAFCLALVLLSGGDYVGARDVTSTWMPPVTEVGNYWIGSVLQVGQAAAEAALGRSSHGVRELIRLADELERRGYLFPAFAARFALTRMHVVVARREAEVRTSWLVRNPWFVARHALPAARLAEEELERLRGEAPARGLGGFLGLIDLSRAQLYSRLRRRERAFEARDALHAFLSDAGVTDLPPPVRMLEDELSAL